MLGSLKQAFSSKKFLAAAIGCVVIALGSALGLSEDQSTKVAGLIVAYVLGQGMADHGKEKAREEAKLAAALEGKTAAEKAAALEAEV